MAAQEKEDDGKTKKSRADGKTLNDAEYSKLAGILVSQRRLGSYPPTVARLLELAGLPWPGEAAVTCPEARKLFLTTATRGAKKEAVLSALVFLVEDKERLANYESTLSYFIERRLAEVKSQCCSVSQMLEKGCNGQVQEALKKQLKERLDARRLPPGIGALKMKGSYQLFIFDQIIGEPTVSTPAVAASRPAQPIGRTAPPSQAADPAEDTGQVEGSTQTAPPSQNALIDERDTAEDPAAGALATRMKDTFDRLDRQSGSNNQVLLYDMRSELGVTRDKFDACMNRLRQMGVFTLSPEEGRFGHLSLEKVEAGMDGPSGRLVYVARR
jgi:hypothetical protein